MAPPSREPEKRDRVVNEATAGTGPGGLDQPRPVRPLRPREMQDALNFYLYHPLAWQLARVLATEGIKVALAARTPADLEGLAKETGAKTFACMCNTSHSRHEGVYAFC